MPVSIAGVAEVEKLEELLGIRFPCRADAEEALTHSSILKEPPGEGRISNDRLAFLGDAVLELLVREDLLLHGDWKREGELTDEKQSIVSNEALDGLARKICLTDFMDFGKSNPHLQLGTRVRSSAMEALLGAMYLGSGSDLAKARELWDCLQN